MTGGFSFRTAISESDHYIAAYARLVEGGSVLWEGLIGNTFVTFDRDGFNFYVYTFSPVGSATPVAITKPARGTRTFSLQVRRTGSGGTLYVSNRFIGIVELRR